MPKFASQNAVVGGCAILPAALMTCPAANGTGWTTAAGAAATAAGATAPLPTPSAAIAATAAPRTRTSARDLLISSPPLRRRCPNRGRSLGLFMIVLFSRKGRCLPANTIQRPWPSGHSRPMLGFGRLVLGLVRHAG